MAVVRQIGGTIRPLDSMLLGVAALLVSAGLLVAAVPVQRPVPLAVESLCPLSKLVIVPD